VELHIISFLSVILDSRRFFFIWYSFWSYTSWKYMCYFYYRCFNSGLFTTKYDTLADYILDVNRSL